MYHHLQSCPKRQYQPADRVNGPSLGSYTKIKLFFSKTQPDVILILCIRLHLHNPGLKFQLLEILSGKVRIVDIQIKVVLIKEVP